MPSPTKVIDAYELLDKYKQRKKKLRDALAENAWLPLVDLHRLTLAELEVEATKAGVIV